MTRLIALANRKGGSGKTATAVSVSAFLAKNKFKTLLVDLDPQAHASISVGISPYQLSCCVKEVLTEDSVDVSELIYKTGFPYLSILPASQRLEGVDDILKKRSSPETILSEKLEPLVSDYDYILFDCPATPGLLLKNGLVAAKELLIPMQTHFLAMEGLAQMTRMVYEINAKFNPALKIIGVIPTLSNLQTRLARTIIKEVIKNFGEEFLFPSIRLDIRLAEAPSYGQPILHYAPNCNGTKDYKNLTQHVINYEFQILK